ncbi:Protein of unknown function [Halanaerobium congolense]|jgi:hypothetical protein|uniref:DUF3919 family protein n=1 Tax=Halanaerobium congolense TaxID=54121 RepID=A0A1I0AG30_9FIRM|nr:DUF3919 family protein [Halanaerobium congolense]PTX17413.1 uncharacterized protein DUF3919 [Halanaerobium congolense]TDP26715.1 uncharacterized protein DUF3919 [Halanaerobium congolense]SDF43220.1 Protein of unknown function [Halanaerobium congolense]SES93226.1 Protein of unknown function [Halanaerobium congolense]SFP25887.1 Protein of unknown function [Halanaerobium congolense]
MKKKVFISLIIIIFLIFSIQALFEYYGLNIEENKNIIIEDQQNFENIINANTPVEIEINDQRWGQTLISDPEVLFTFWKIFSNLNIYPGENISNKDLINGKVHFFDGKEKDFTLSNRFKLGDYYYGSREEEIEVKKLYNLINDHLNNKNNLVMMLKEAENVYLYTRNQYLDPDSKEIINLQDQKKSELIELIYQSEKIEYDNEFNKFILEEGYNPIYHLALSFDKKNKSEELIILSVLSEKYFATTDMNQTNRNIIYYKGNIFSFTSQLFTKNLINND